MSTLMERADLTHIERMAIMALLMFPTCEYGSIETMLRYLLGKMRAKRAVLSVCCMGLSLFGRVTDEAIHRVLLLISDLMKGTPAIAQCAYDIQQAIHRELNIFYRLVAICFS